MVITGWRPHSEIAILFRQTRSLLLWSAKIRCSLRRPFCRHVTSLREEVLDLLSSATTHFLSPPSRQLSPVNDSNETR